MIKKLGFFSTILFSITTNAEEVMVKPNEVFNVLVAAIHAPSSKDWVLSEKTAVLIRFINKNEGLLAQASFHNFPGPYDKNSILLTAKTYVKDSAIASGGKLLTDNYIYTEERGFPCVKVRQSLKINLFTSVQQHILMCVMPKYKHLGAMALFSYPGKESIPQLESDALAFISGVKIKYD